MTPADAGDAGAIRPNARFMLSDPAHLVAQGFGSGLAPIMPGTFGTLFAWLTFHVLSTRWPAFFTPGTWTMVIAAGFLAGVWACGRTARNMGVADHGSMVWDEVIGFWAVLLFVTPSGFGTQLWAFFWFRVFDMLKPPPIRQIDRHVSGGLGVMWDDLAAAFYTLLLFAVWRSL
ncbi:MAG TPA: phosphatidylglycerophosphatase A [Noviherbaspirillum sp.]|jgi:phosphatidylglycerophosphatase A|uniref:phosphatidylglycerophosphatase A family protein n=1 Tax=Noviherbaspirillum sp. TaxID=1926288 RepID=UPI002F93611D